MKILTASLFVFLAASTFANEPLISSLNKDIKQAQAKLNKSQQAINKEKSQLSRQLKQAEDDVAKLRKQASGLIRAEDENAVSLADLNKRLDNWQQQSRYQSSKLQRFISAQSLASNSTTNIADLETLLTTVANYNSKFERQSQGFYKDKIILPNGTEVDSQVLKLGPYHYFKSYQLSGIADKSDSLLETSLLFNETQQSQLNELVNSGHSLLAVDPSAGRALQRQQHNEDITSHVAKGGVWALPILGFALFALCIATYKLIQLFKLPKLQAALAQRAANVIAEDGDIKTLKLGVWQSNLVDISTKHSVGQQRDDLLFNALNDQKKKLDNLLGAIAVTAAVAPLLGLLGTVSGMIETFKLMTLFGAGDPAAVSGGISEALVTTELGLVVAIPALLCHAFLSRKSKNYYHQLEQSAIELSQCHFEKPVAIHRGVA